MQIDGKLLLWLFGISFTFTFCLIFKNFFSITITVRRTRASWTLLFIFFAKLKIILSVDPCDCDHEWSQNKTETTRQSRVNKRIQNIPHNVAFCRCVREKMWTWKKGRWIVAYTSFNKRDWLYAIAYSFSSFRLIIFAFHADRTHLLHIFMLLFVFAYFTHSAHTNTDKVCVKELKIYVKGPIK